MRKNGAYELERESNAQRKAVDETNLTNMDTAVID